MARTVVFGALDSRLRGNDEGTRDYPVSHPIIFASSTASSPANSA